DYAVWQREQVAGGLLERQLAYWRERLAGAPALLELPTDHPRPAVQSYRGAIQRVAFSGALRDRLQALARREGATLYMVLLGAFQALLSAYGAGDDVVVGTTIAGRTRAEVEPLIGLFMNTLVLRTGLGGDPAFREVLRRVREVTLGAYEHQEVPFERLVTELRPGRSLGHTPLFQVLFELHNTAGPGGGLAGVEARGVGVEPGTAKFDLALALAPAMRGLAGSLTYATDLFEPATARRMVRHLERVLEQVTADPDRRLSALELLEPEERRTREATLGAYEHQEVPFERLVAELQPERTLSHAPLFQVMFSLQNAVDRGVALPGLEVSGVEAELASAKFDLFLMPRATAQGLRVGLNYSTDLFERSTVDRMLGHLERVLEQVARDPDRRLSRLELLGEAERALVLEEWNRTERPYPRGVCVHELFEAQARERPEAVALVWGEAELTYRELDARANRLAHHLAGLGVGPESRVGLRVERSVENVVATLAVLKAGGCCVPVDTSYPPERMALMLADSAVRVLLSDAELAAPGLHVIRLDQVADALASESV
ncbi:MAG TPA: condensation domain-containing protein, partial [Longimicrobiaceae bacterium]